MKRPSGSSSSGAAKGRKVLTGSCGDRDEERRASHLASASRVRQRVDLHSAGNLFVVGMLVKDVVLDFVVRPEPKLTEWAY
jgi:hypothetical protein